MLTRDILPRLEGQIGDMLKNMKDVNMKVCSELQMNLRSEEQRSTDLIAQLS